MCVSNNIWLILHASKLIIWGSSWGRGFRFHWLGMSYAKRVEKREEEMSALKNALCILDIRGKHTENNSNTYNSVEHVVYLPNYYKLYNVCLNP